MFKTLEAQRVYQAALAGLTQHGARDAERAAAELAQQVDDAAQARARGDVDSLAARGLHRAEVIEHLRIRLPRDGHETRRAREILQQIETAAGAEFPVSPLREQFLETPLAIWDKEGNRYLCKSCSTWANGDGYSPLAPVTCTTCSERVVP